MGERRKSEIRKFGKKVSLTSDSGSLLAAAAIAQSRSDSLRRHNEVVYSLQQTYLPKEDQKINRRFPSTAISDDFADHNVFSVLLYSDVLICNTIIFLLFAEYLINICSLVKQLLDCLAIAGCGGIQHGE